MLFRIFYASLILHCISILSQAQTLIRGPYLTMNTSSSIHILWNTNVPCKGNVRYGISPNAMSAIVYQNQLSIHHDVLLTNLLPSTKYYYAIAAPNVNLQGDSANYFITAPIASASYEKPIRIWAVGDVAKQTQQQLDVRNSFEKYNDSNYIDGWIMLGDNAYNSGLDAEWQNGFFNYYQNNITKHTPLWPCLGNHEYANDSALRRTHNIPYFDIFSLPAQAEMGGIVSNSERYYSFNYGNIHFVHLDSYGLDSVNGNFYSLSDTLQSPQITWLKQDLQANQLLWLIVSFHHPPYTMGSHNSDAESDLVAIRTNVIPILERYNVDLVLNGHSHVYERSNFVKNHFGFESTFNSFTHIRQIGNGRYDGSPNSCAYLKSNYSISSSDSGTVYSVIGSGSAIPATPQLTWPHNAMSYSNSTENGSMLITVEGNRLNAKWISTDTMHVVKDQFTILKAKNKIDTIYTAMPATFNLNANWMADKYFWNTDDSTRSIQVNVAHNYTIIVSDEWNCISNTFVFIDTASPASTHSASTLNLKIFPNPIHSKLNIEMDYIGDCKFDIYNLEGKLVLHKNEFFNHFSSISLNDSLPSAEYFLNIKMANGNTLKQNFYKK
jgi:acid phosphatase type 7